jgi:hypothetical protein
VEHLHSSLHLSPTDSGFGEPPRKLYTKVMATQGIIEGEDTEESKKSLELGPIKDVEDGGQNEKAENTEAEFQRPMTNLRWFSVCVGLYLTALLYGKCLLRFSLNF